MFNPSTYNINNSAGSVDMSFSFEGTAYDPNFTWTGDIDISNAIHSVSYTIEDNLSPNSSDQLNAFVDELYTKGIPRATSTTLINDGYITSSSQEEAESLFEILNYIAEDGNLQYGTVGVPDITASGTLTVTYGANTSGNSLTSTINARVDVPDSDTLTFSGTIIQSDWTPIEASLEFGGDKTKTLSYNETTAYFFIRTTNITSVSVSFSGNVDVTNHTLTATDNGYQLYVYTANNTTTSLQETTITATGTTIQGTTLTDTATIKKKGVPGSISLNPSEVTVSKASGTIASTITVDGVSDLQTEYWGSGGTTTVSTVGIVNNNLGVGYLANNTGNTVTNYVKVSGTDSYGDEQYATLVITQLGVDPSITIDPTSRTVEYNSDYTSYGITSNNVSNLIATSSESWLECEIDERLHLAYSINTSTSQRTATITVSGTSPIGTVTATATLTQKASTGRLTITPSTYTTDGAAETKTFTVTSDGVSNIRTSNSGDISFTSVRLSGSTLIAVMPINNSHSTKTSTITLTGTDANGDTVTASTTIEQRTVPEIVFGETSRTLGATEPIAYYPVRVYNVENPTVTIDGNVSISNYDLEQDESDTTLYYLFIRTNDNTSATQLTSTITISGTSALGTVVAGTATLIKQGTGGSITITPTSKTVSKSAGSTTFDITIVDVAEWTPFDETGDIRFTDFEVTGNTLTVSYPANTSDTSRTGYFNLRGTDSNGNNVISQTITVNQLGTDPSITINPDSKTLQAEEANGQYIVLSDNVSNLTVSVSGNVNITDYHLTEESFGHYLYVTTANNTGTTDLTSTFTVSGTDVLGNTRTATATLIKKAPAAGSITIDPFSRRVGYEAGSTTFTVTPVNIVGDLSLSVVDTTTMSITDYGLNGNVLTISYGANSRYPEKTAAIKVAGTDSNGEEHWVLARITQEHPPVTGVISVTPSTRAVSSDAGTTTYSVATTDIDTNTLTVSNTGSVNITSCTLSNDKRAITVIYGANSSTTTAKSSTITITGEDYGGTQRTATATITQTRQNAPVYTFAFEPASQSAISVSRITNSVHYTITSLKTITSGSSTLGYTATITSKTGTWQSNPSIQYDANQIPYVLIPTNIGTSSRTVKITFTQNESGLTLVSTITQNGSGTVSNEFLPIWKENELTDTSGSDFIEYHITLGSEIIYAGKAYKYPDASSIKWVINDICSNYLGNGIVFNNGIHQIPNYCKTFNVETNSRVIMSDTFYNSWAYTDTNYLLSDPIDYRIDPRQWLPISFLSSSSRTINIGGTTYTASSSNNGWTVMTDLSGLTVDCNNGIVVNPSIGNSFKYTFGCGDYVLYYANAYGGWDSLLCNATSKKTDNIEHMNYRRKSKTLSEFGKVNYQNNITPTWSLNTGITVNGKKMYHLLESTMVYLHNLETNEIIPVVITNAQCEYLDYTNNGKKPYYYNITVEESNQKLRK